MASRKETREVSGFDEVRLEGSGFIHLQQGEQDALEIEADEALLPKIKSEVKDGRLELGFNSLLDNLLILGGETIHFTITMRKVHALIISGSGKVEAPRINTDSLKLKVSGAGKLTINELHTQQMEVNCSGSGSLLAGGEAQHLDIHISGSGEVHGALLASQEVRVRISGSGTIEVQASDKLDVQVSGAGTVRYQGNPSIRQHITGTGSVRPL